MRRPEFIARQSARPSGPLGALIAAIMARETARENAVALDLIELRPGDRVLEIGFGHGLTIARAAAAVGGGFVAGVDHSPAMVRLASRRNREAEREGRVELRLTDAAEVPYADGAFNKALAVHAVYFWPDLDAVMAEIRRVLEPGGLAVLAFRDDDRARAAFPPSVYRFPPADSVAASLRRHGFGRVRTESRPIGTGTCHFVLADQ